MKKVYKYATGDTIPEGAIYLKTIKNGLMPKYLSGGHAEDLVKTGIPSDYYYVWHYFLVEVDNDSSS